MFLQFMGSPILSDAPVSEIDVVRAMVVMTRPITEVMSLWFGSDGSIISPEEWQAAIGKPQMPPTEFDAEAWAIADQVGLEGLRELGEHVKAYVDAAFKTAVPVKTPDSKEGMRPKESADSPRESAGN